MSDPLTYEQLMQARHDMLQYAGSLSGKAWVMSPATAEELCTLRDPGGCYVYDAMFNRVLGVPVVVRADCEDGVLRLMDSPPFSEQDVFDLVAGSRRHD